MTIELEAQYQAKIVNIMNFKQKVNFFGKFLDKFVDIIKSKYPLSPENFYI